MTYLFASKKKKVFPSIRTVIVPAAAVDILDSCPNVRVVGIIGIGFLRFHQRTKTFEKVLSSCPDLEELKGFEAVQCIEDQGIRDIVKHLPKTRRIQLEYASAYFGRTARAIDLLRELPELEEIELSIGDVNYWDAAVKELSQHALEVLRASPTTNPKMRKRVIITFEGRGDRSWGAPCLLHHVLPV